MAAARLASVTEFDLGDFLPKKLKKNFAPDLTQFATGSIIRIKLKNFMSYSLTEFHFGPTMNLIIGPNGTGKSTIVCAVCIGLAGKLDYLGKASMNLEQFIKTGESHATIELELKSRDNSTVIIKREFHKKGKSDWKLNNRSSNESQIKKMLKEFNIQLDNLCQFLPQDRVARFASLKPEELLKEIERSYGDGELLTQHLELNKLYAEREEFKKTLGENEARLRNLKEKNEGLKEKTLKFKEYQQLEKDLAIHKSMRPMVELQSKRDIRNELKDKMSALNEKIRQFDENILPLKNTIAEADTSSGDFANKQNKIAAKQASLTKSITENFSEIEQIDKKIAKHISEKGSLETSLEAGYVQLKAMHEEYAKKKVQHEAITILPEEEFERLKAERAELNDQIVDSTGPVESLNEEITLLKNQNRKLDRQISELQMRFSSKDKLARLDEKHFNNIIQIVKLLRENKEREKLVYFEPPIVSISLKDSRYAPALEQSIRYQNQCAITVPTHNDFVRLSDFLYKKHARIGKFASIRTLSSKTSISSPTDSANIKALGFDGYLTDFIQGPKEVMQMLCENEYLHCVPVSVKDIDDSQKTQMAERIKKNPKFGILKYISGDSIYNFNRSSFGQKQVTTNIKSFNLSAKVFSDGLSEEQKQEIESTTNSLKSDKEKTVPTLQALQSELADKTADLDALKEKGKTVSGELSRQARAQKFFEKSFVQLETLKARLLVKKKNVQKMKDTDKQGEALKLNSKIEKLAEKKLELLYLIGNDITKMNTYNEKLSDINFLSIQEENKIQVIKSLHEEILKKRENLNEMKEQLKLDYRSAKEAYKKAETEYKKLVSEFTQEQVQDIKDLCAKFNERGELTQDGLQKEIQRIQSQMALRRNTGGTAALKELESNEIAMNQLITKNIPHHQMAIANYTDKIEELSSEWKPKLLRVISRINRDFSADLSTVASAGEVQLDSESENFAEWKLKILVSFRDTQELTQLNAAQQSGGEKSATTAVFLNSLQGLTNTPFRVVDEINQGMDSKNERLIHKLIVNKACFNEKSSQYFLITPKLLTDLYYGPGMTVHCILAGRWCPEIRDNVEFLEMGISEKYC